VKLSTFITTHLEEILEAWEQSSRRQAPPDQQQRKRALRDHLGELLQTVTRDLEAPSHAERPRSDSATERRDARAHLESVGEKHGAGRAEQGFTLEQMTSEFPLLRSCVIRLWLRSRTSVAPDDAEDLARFNEAIDLAFTKSVSEFVERIDRSKKMFLAVLGHDLRNPISAISMAAQLMLEVPQDQKQMHDLAKRIASIGERMRRMVADLLDFTRSHLGGQIPITPHATDLQQTVKEAADEITTSHPNRTVRVHVDGDLHGNWDDQRIRQALGNLLGNAVHHGAPDTAIDLSARGEESEVAIAVHNEGPPIPPERLAQIFEPLVGMPDAKGATGRDSNHLGLGLYIANEIMRAHGGRIDVDSSPQHGTTFTMHLPRAA
jgi:signal transduction histidine kinase